MSADYSTYGKITEVMSDKDVELVSEKEKINMLLVDLACDYSKYLKVDVSHERTVLEDEIEDILTRLDEFCALVDMVRSDDSLCLSNTLPEIYGKSQEMEKVFSKIDKLECFINVVKQNIDTMEEKVAEAEYLLESSSVKKLFTSLQKPLFSKKVSDKKSPKYDPPEIFQTDVFFANSVKETEEVVQNDFVGVPISDSGGSMSTTDVSRPSV